MIKLPIPYGLKQTGVGTMRPVYKDCTVTVRVLDIGDYSMCAEGVEQLYELSKIVPLEQVQVIQTRPHNIAVRLWKVKEWILGEEGVVLYLEDCIKDCFRKGETCDIRIIFKEYLEVDYKGTVWKDHKPVMTLNNINE